MRKTFTVLVAVAFVAGVALEAAADAQKRKRRPPRERTVEMPYTEPALGAAGVGLCFQGSSCVFMEPSRGERFVNISIEDDLGLPVYATIIQDTSGDGSYLATDDYHHHICGETPEPIEIEPRMTVTVWVWHGPGADPPCAGTATSGTVTATFLRRLQSSSESVTYPQ